MSKKKTTVRPFDVKAYAYYLRKAKGRRSVHQFASDCKITPFYVKHSLSGEITAPPLPQTLRRISDASEGFVPYYRLLYIAGYDLDQCYTMTERDKELYEFFGSVLKTIAVMAASEETPASEDFYELAE